MGKLYPGMKDVRTGTILDSSTVSSAAKDYMTQGGAKIRFRLWTGQFEANGNEIFTEGENLDLDTGYYYLSYQTHTRGVPISCACIAPQTGQGCVSSWET